jgi:hypothetical protein
MCARSFLFQVVSGRSVKLNSGVVAIQANTGVIAVWEGAGPATTLTLRKLPGKSKFNYNAHFTRKLEMTNWKV